MCQTSRLGRLAALGCAESGAGLAFGSHQRIEEDQDPHLGRLRPATCRAISKSYNSAGGVAGKQIRAIEGCTCTQCGEMKPAPFLQ